MRIFKYSKIVILSILLLILFPKNAIALTNFSNWQQNTSLPYAIANQTSFTNAGKIYVIGGSATKGASHSEVMAANIGTDGTLSSWSIASNLPSKLIWHSVATNTSNVYVLGGYLDDIDGVSANVDTVYESTLNSSGSLGSWQTLKHLPHTLCLGSSIIAGNKIYYAGGSTNGVDTNYALSTIYAADINPGDGSIGDWSDIGNLPDQMAGFGMMEINGYLYVFGGHNKSGITSAVERAKINSDNTFGNWESQPSLPQQIWYFGITRVGNTLITAGGITGAGFTDKVYYSTINADGSISAWQTSSNSLPRVNVGSPLVSWGNHVYLTGGHDGSNYFDAVLSATVQDGTPAPVSVTKVFLIPGLGASWNVDALINCKDSGYDGSWTLAPYAKNVYDPFLSKLPSKGWGVIPFYYDWRQDVKNNATLLNTFIDHSSLSQGEKVDLVGHSMGGLVGRNYLESQSGGKASKFLAVGTPNQGSALAYPAVVNGEVWANDLVEKIAATLLIKHCGVPSSLKNLLPTYNYLRDSKTKQLKDVSTMKAQNNYLPTSFVSNFWGVKVGTLAGTGQATLKVIDVIRDSKWPDGKPIDKENVNEGDGTVLVASAQIPGAYTNEVINESHSGIIASDEGINKILEFLGSPGITDPEYSEPKSALILVGYPGSFSITDENGAITQSDQGIIAIMDPKNQNYQLQINPISSSTTFIVGQFLSNGQVSYKEYKFKGLTQDPKVIEFNSRYVNGNPLHEVRDYGNPHFPKLWLQFWKFWSKYWQKK